MRPLYESSKILAQKMTVAVSFSNLEQLGIMFVVLMFGLFIPGSETCKANCTRDKWRSSVRWRASTCGLKKLQSKTLSVSITSITAKSLLFSLSF